MKHPVLRLVDMVKNPTSVKHKDIRTAFKVQSKKPVKGEGNGNSLPPPKVSSPAIVDDEPETKRQKVNESEPETIPKRSTVKPLKCDKCKQLLNTERLKLFHGDENSAVEEFIALASESLSLFDGDSTAETEWDDKPQHRITNFTVYDEYGHLCPFDTGLIDENVHLYFSGYIKPVYDDTPALEGGVHGSKLGPIDGWYIAGFDGGEKELIGFTTAYAEYLLSQPSEQYSGLFNNLREKAFLSKTVIEVLESSPELTIEDLINRIQLIVPPENCTKFTEESLLKHSQFLVEQIESYDRAADDNEDLLITIPAVRGLIKLSGVLLGTGKERYNKTAAKKREGTKTKSTDISHATVTPLVQASFEGIFVDQMTSTERKVRCNDCEVCKAPDCGECSTCKDKVKFGGTGKRRQACSNKKCPYMAVRNAEASSEDELSDEIPKKSVIIEKKAEVKKSSNIDGRFTGDIICKEGKKWYYSTAEIENTEIKLGDFVAIAPELEVPDYVGRILHMYTKHSDNYIHIHWMSGVQDTILGAGHDTDELFLTDLCDDIPLGSVLRKVPVNYRTTHPDWNMRGGLPVPKKTDDEFYVKFWYDTERARFEEPLASYMEWESGGSCPACQRRSEKELSEIPQLDDKCESLSYLEEVYKAGDYVYILPEAFHLPNRFKSGNVTRVRKDSVDEEMFPEYYRKSDYIKGNNDSVPDPYRIGRIVSFQLKQSETLDKTEHRKIKVVVKKMYRPENVAKYSLETADINLLLYSLDQVKVDVTLLRGKCTVLHVDEVADLHSYSRIPDHYYMSEMWSSKDKALSDLPLETRSCNKGKSKKPAMSRPSKPLFEKLRTLDVFAGCGGLSEGFHQAGIAEPAWAIEFFSEAAQAYKLNNPETIVFNEDCNKILKMAMDGSETNSLGQRIPKKGEVDLLCGGPPCQGFSGMNRFNAGEYSKFKNSLISSYLSYCEYYRPRYFILENVRNFVSFKRSMVLKVCLSSLVSMGYQCTFGVLQAGSYGVAQTRRRAFLLAAAPGEVLPNFPQPRHVFSPKAMSLKVTVNDKQYKDHISRYDSAPLRNITVRDILSDLPPVSNGASKRELPYDSAPTSWFERQIRGDCLVLTDHVCKEMNPLVAIRMQHIPLTPGSDWRDLPNISVTLPDGKKTPILVYTHNDVKNGPMMGVCSCAEGRRCDPMDKQSGTLIPWCLPHTGNRHNHWAGLYGRVFWDGFFSTTITNPEPMGKQGRVLHPEQHRVVTVRECARSQGFPDSYKFYGNLLDRHRQVGNAVPPPLAKAIGDEIKKSLVAVSQRNKKK